MEKSENKFAIGDVVYFLTLGPDGWSRFGMNKDDVARFADKLKGLVTS